MAEKELQMQEDKVCKGNCLDHSGISANVSTLQSQIDVLLPLPKTVEGLSGRFNFLILLIIALLLAIITAITYSFNAVNNFSNLYTENKEKDRIERKEFRDENNAQLKAITETQAKMKLDVQGQIFELSKRIDTDVKDKINDLSNSIDNRMDGITERLIKIEANNTPE